MKRQIRLSGPAKFHFKTRDQLTRSQERKMKASAPGKPIDFFSYFGKRNPNPVTGLVMQSLALTCNSLHTRVERQRYYRSVPISTAQRAYPVKSNTQATPRNMFCRSEKSGSVSFNWRGKMVSRCDEGPLRTSPQQCISRDQQLRPADPK